MAKQFKSQRGMIDIILILVVFVAALGIGGYFYYQNKQNQKTYDAAGNGSTVSKHAATKKTPAATSTTKTYSSSVFTLNYPSTWTDVGTGGDSTLDAAISNEGKGAPLEGDNSHVFLTLQHSASSLNSCFPTNLLAKDATSSVAFQVDGLAGKKYLVGMTPSGGESVYATVYATVKSGVCYNFEFQSQTQATRDAKLGTADTIIKSLKFK